MQQGSAPRLANSICSEPEKCEAFRLLERGRADREKSTQRKEGGRGWISQDKELDCKCSGEFRAGEVYYTPPAVRTDYWKSGQGGNLVEKK